MIKSDVLSNYWKENKTLMLMILLIWFVISYGSAIVASYLNKITIFGFPLGYYMGAQGSLIVFVILNVLYSKKTNELDKKYGLQEEE